MSFREKVKGEWGIGKTLFMLYLIPLLLIGCSKKNAKDDPYLGENALSEQKSLIEKYISDPGKRGQLLQILADFELSLKAFSERQAQQHERMQELTANYNATREDFENSINDFNTEYDTLLKNMAAKRMEMKALTTAEEWAAISGKRKKSILKN